MLIKRVIDIMTYPILFLKLSLQHFRFKHRIQIKKYFYGESRNQYFYLSIPKSITKQKIVFFVNGSGWTSYFTFFYKFIGSFFGLFGYISIVCSHHKAPKHTFPTQINDIILAFKETLKIAEKHDLPKEIIFLGYSSGAQIVSLLAYSNYLEQQGFSKENIKGVVSISGPINFYVCKNKLLCNVIKNYVSTLVNKDSADPYTHLDSGNLKPILCIHDKNDPFVEVENSITFIDKVNQLDRGKGDLILLDNYYHHNILKIFLFPDYNQALIKWLEKID